jgi:hypothetical protein
MRIRQVSAGVFSLLAFCTVPLLADISASFIDGSNPLTQVTTFSDTNNGITATFSTPADPGGFITSSPTFFTWGPEMLIDPGPAGAAGIPLQIAFSTPLDSIKMNFATDGNGLFDLNAYSGGSLVGSASVAGTNLFSFPEGTISFGGANFDTVVLTSPSTPFFAIGNIDVSANAGVAPEPTYLLILPAMICGLVMLKIRRAAPRS